MGLIPMAAFMATGRRTSRSLPADLKATTQPHTTLAEPGAMQEVVMPWRMTTSNSLSWGLMP